MVYFRKRHVISLYIFDIGKRKIYHAYVNRRQRTYIKIRIIDVSLIPSLPQVSPSLAKNKTVGFGIL